ncbi:G-protein subunit alpha 4 [Reticulomyxa filosa]|uniref:G-protein subunit alpha 4 n=1 Tax=Reticulomyxa filosa TaxID=46433 RepID=X6MVL8_RETFI|nr:G-protein subunit alpha 4 [Reticulomyxa filosa]|eukprot:ETO17497.1 G-protein subunit alpha 4 [Reticulomyxa filosa]
MVVPPYCKFFDFFLQKNEEKKEEGLRILLLGGGGAGKSTIFKNLMNVERVPTKTSEEEKYTMNKLRGILVEYMLKLLEKSHELYEKNSQENADCVIEKSLEIEQHIAQNDEKFDQEEWMSIGTSIAYLWRLPAIQATYAKRARFAFVENADSFFDRVTDIMDLNYQLIEEDVLKMQIRTTGLDFSSPFFFFFLKKKLIPKGERKNF